MIHKKLAKKAFGLSPVGQAPNLAVGIQDGGIQDGDTEPRPIANTLSGVARSIGRKKEKFARAKMLRGDLT